MIIWDQMVDLLCAIIIACSNALGGQLGLGIMTVGFLVRLAILPLSLHVARLSAARQASMRKLKPRLDRLRERFGTDPHRLGRETGKLLEEEGVKLLPLAGCVSMLLQLPVLLALYSAVRRCAAVGGRFLWVRNLASPDALVALLAAGLTGLAVAIGSGSVDDQRKLVIVLLPTAVILVVLMKLSAGIGLYWIASSFVTVAQALIVRRERRALGA